VHHFIKRCVIFVVLLSSFYNAFATHIVGGEFTYTYLGDTTISAKTMHKYQVSLSIYEDCLNGQPGAIAQDNPAWLGVYDGMGNIVEMDTGDNGVCCGIPFSLSVTVAPNLSITCVSNIPPTCLLKKTFTKIYYLAPNSSGYLVSYQRCCRNASIVNVSDPGDEGCTYFCSIPASPIVNNSAVFKNYPPQIICSDNPLYYDHSANDADGDSLSYGFSPAYTGGSEANVKPVPLPPPYDSVSYISPEFSSQSPIDGNPTIQIDPVTGLITGTPDIAGRYLVNVYCNEWRSGALINTIRREFQFVVTPCSPKSGNSSSFQSISIMAGDSLQFSASGSSYYLWSPATYLSDPYIPDPIGYFPVAGQFNYILHTVTSNNCEENETVTVNVLDHSDIFVPGAFTPNDDGKNDVLQPIPVLNSTLRNFKVFNRKGNMVYNGGPNDKGWNGDYRGVKQDTGAYYWELEYTDNTGETRRKKGDVTLIR